MAKLDDILQEFRNEVGPEFVATDVVGMDGLSIAGFAANDSFDRSASAARFAMVMKLASRVSDKLSIGNVDDNLVTTDSAFALTRFLGDGSYYWEVVVTNEATLGVIRMLMSEYASQLWDAIPR